MNKKTKTMLSILTIFSIMLYPVIGKCELRIEMDKTFPSNTNTNDLIYRFKAIQDESSKTTDWQYKWSLDGPGRIEPYKDNSQIIFIYSPDQIRSDTNAIITLNAISSNSDEKRSATFNLALDQHKNSTVSSDYGTTKIILSGVAIAAAVGGAIALSNNSSKSSNVVCNSDGTGTPSIFVTAPSENGPVSWTSSVSGTAMNCSDGDYVTIFIQPYGYGWYQQSSLGHISNSTWSVNPCYFGNQNNSNDIGRYFQIRAELRSNSGSVRATYTVNRVIRNS